MRRKVATGEDKGGPDTASEQLETQEKDVKGQDGEEKPVEKPVEEKEETKPVTRGRKEQDSETTPNDKKQNYRKSHEKKVCTCAS